MSEIFAEIKLTKAQAKECVFDVTNCKAMKMKQEKVLVIFEQLFELSMPDHEKLQKDINYFANVIGLTSLKTPLGKYLFGRLKTVYVDKNKKLYLLNGTPFNDYLTEQIKIMKEKYPARDFFNELDEEEQKARQFHFYLGSANSGKTHSALEKNHTK